ncbi:MAG: putative membrane protein [Planctomycetota bacterium]|jgi:uncharacterized membrane protein
MIWIGIGIGCAAGVVAGVYGTYRSISRARTPAAKKNVIRLNVYGWVSISVFLALMLALPSHYSFLLWIPYGLGFPLFIRYAKKQDACSGTEGIGDV